MLKKILYVLLAFILYFMISLIAGWGPYVDVSSHTQPGQEYPAPNEEQVAEETAALVLASNESPLITRMTDSADAELEQLAGDCGFRVASHFRDRRGYFTDSLWVRG